MKPILILLLSIFLLSACQKNDNHLNKQNSNLKIGVINEIKEGQASLDIQVDGESIESSPYHLNFKDGQTLIEIMKANNINVEIRDGLVASLEGYSENLNNNRVWLYSINGEMAPVAAREYEVQAGDKILWKLESLVDK